MILKAKDFKNACKSILDALDTTLKIEISEKLELLCGDNKLVLNVTNGDYFVSVILDVEDDEEFKATIDAKKFLSLISKITTNELELGVEGNALIVKANGTYKLPMSCSDGKLIGLKPIVINNITSEFNIDSDILLSIFNYNSKMMDTKGASLDSKKRMCYIDEQGAITFNVGACVNNFTLEQPVKILITNKVVKLFKLFKDNSSVQFSIGFDEVNGEVKSKVKFDSGNICITSILPSDNLKAGIPVKAIRNLVENIYAYSINMDRVELSQAIDRLLLLAEDKKDYKFNFECDKLIISDLDSNSSEVISYTNTSIDTPYAATLDLEVLKATLDGCQEQYLTMYFGDGRAVIVSRGNVKNIIPED